MEAAVVRSSALLLVLLSLSTVPALADKSSDFFAGVFEGAPSNDEVGTLQTIEIGPREIPTTLEISAQSRTKVIQGTFEQVVCVDSDTVNVRDDKLSDTPLFRVQKLDPVKLFQGWGENKKVKTIDGVQHTYVKAEFPKAAAAGKNIGWISQAFVKAAADCPAAVKKAAAEKAAERPGETCCCAGKRPPPPVALLLPLGRLAVRLPASPIRTAANFRSAIFRAPPSRAKECGISAGAAAVDAASTPPVTSIASKVTTFSPWLPVR